MHEMIAASGCDQLCNATMHGVESCINLEHASNWLGLKLEHACMASVLMTLHSPAQMT